MISPIRRAPGWLACSLLLAASGALSEIVLAADADHLLLSEVVVQSRPVPLIGSKYIEIVNPTGEAVALEGVYLTDATTDPSTFYYNIVTGSGAGGGIGGDFHARFPDGATIAPGDTIVVSLRGSTEFEAAYGRRPDFELYEDGFTPDAVAEMVEAFPGSIGKGLGSAGGNEPDLSSTAETVILYAWDGQSDLVQDLDYLIWGNITSVRANKTGISRDGPDADEVLSAYQPDTNVNLQQPVSSSAHNFGQSFQRNSFDEAAEAASGGNGQTGHDETSEPLASTWSIVATQDPPAAPASPHPPAPIVEDVSLEPVEPFVGQTTTVTASLLSFDGVAAMSVFYSVDGGAFTEASGSDVGSGNWSASIPAQAEGTVVRWYVAVTGSGGGEATEPAAVPAFPASFTVAPPPPPIFAVVLLNPPAPYADQATTVSTGFNPAGSPAVAVSLLTSIDGGAFTAQAMTAAGDTWSAVIPAQATDTEVRWYLRAEAGSGAESTYPAGAPEVVESFVVLAEQPPISAAVHLLLTEIATKSTEGEFIEIYNPTAEPVDLSNYYLTDAVFTNQYYWRIVRPNPSSGTVGGGTFNDFHARFPAGAVIAPGEALTVSVAGSDAFSGVYGLDPDFELYEDADTADDIPDMREIFPGSITGGLPADPPTLTNGSESIVFYYWNGASDLVTDIDVFFWGSDTRWRFSKSSDEVNPIDGPDADSIGSEYQTETPVGAQLPFLNEHDFGLSYQRTERDEGRGQDPPLETGTASNGVGGHDELSEDLPGTWREDTVTPGVVVFLAESGGAVELDVPARTFLPKLGEEFPIRFTSRTGLETTIRIFDMEGRLVRTMFDSRFDGAPSNIPGVFTVRAWDGRDSEFQLVKAGIYVIHLSAVDPRTGDQKNETAPVVVATRLSK